MTVLLHYVLAVGCFIGSLRPSVLSVVIRVRLPTRLSIGSFFFLTGCTQVIALTGHNTTLDNIDDILRIFAVSGTLVFMYLDQYRVTRRMANALGAIRDEYDGLAVVEGARGREMIANGDAKWLDIGHTVAATVSHALLDSDE